MSNEELVNSPRGTVIISGASRGIGAGTALMAADDGYAVCVNYRTNRAAAELVVLAASAN